jgi:adenosylcobinamide-phosphate synthase
VWLHPVVLMGKLLGWSGQALAPRAEVPRDYLRFAWQLVWCALAALFFMVYGLAQFMLGFAPGGSGVW